MERKRGPTARRAPLRTYVINRGFDLDRWASVSASVASYDFLQLQRVPAVDGHAPGFNPRREVPDLIGNLTNTPTNRRARGMMAVFMSHAKCWQRIAESGDAAGLVLEDDVVITPEINAMIEVFDTSAPPHDLIFVNRRMHRQLMLAFDGAPADAWTPVTEVLARLEARLAPGEFDAKRGRGKGILTAPGGDAYILSASAARALLDLVREKGRLIHVDLFLLFAAAGRSAFDGMARLPHLYHDFAEVGDLVLDGRIYREPCVKNVSGFAQVSTREGLVLIDAPAAEAVAPQPKSAPKASR